MSHIYDLNALSFDLSRFSDESRDYQSPYSDQAIQTLHDWLNGKPVNQSENRAAMHMALRADTHSALPKEYTKPAIDERVRMRNFVDQCDAKNIVHIGIGGSDFGPRFVIDALSNAKAPQRNVSFLSTLTPETIEQTMNGLNIDETVFVLASKSFTTDETSFLCDVLRNDYNVPQGHFIALTAAPDKAKASGFQNDQIFSFWDWVGGRYSLWSSIGITIALAYGWQTFDELLKGARIIDNELIENKEQSAIWTIAQILQAERVLHKRSGLAILPYHNNLSLLSTHLQQLIMESNGKPCDDISAPIVFGNTGTEFQHSFGQYLHQGPDITTSIFITVHNTMNTQWQKDAQKRLHANALAQANTLWAGRPSDDGDKNITGKRPSIMIKMPELSASNIGSLLAIFEHITVIDAFLMNINPFDQWGVEAGKVMARDIMHERLI